VLHQVVREHFETSRVEVAGLRRGQGLPKFVEQEFREFLTCGCLAADLEKILPIRHKSQT
jgi:hypothetical protein